VARSRRRRQTDERTQRTLKDQEIRVPTRGEVLGDLRKVAKAAHPASEDSDADEGGAEQQQPEG
jgi:hypothetical protein